MPPRWNEDNIDEILMKPPFAAFKRSLQISVIAIAERRITLNYPSCRSLPKRFPVRYPF